MARLSNDVKCDQWRARLARFETSNLTVAEFCRREQVALAGYYYRAHSARLFALVVGLILVAAAVRLASLLSAPSPPADLSPVRAAVSQWLETTSPLPINADGSISTSSLDPQLVQLGVERMEVQRFDPTALVMIRAGIDGQPGVAGVDDNGDAVVDNRTELGATGSDDVCVVVKADDRPRLDQPTLVLQRGAFVPVVAAASRDQEIRQRAIVIGQTGQDPWSFLIPLGG